MHLVHCTGYHIYRYISIKTKGFNSQYAEKFCIKWEVNFAVHKIQQSIESPLLSLCLKRKEACRQKQNAVKENWCPVYLNQLGYG
ncbi:MAG: hypothetical protein MESAZ_00257 [Saezia sanguinis]